MKCKWSVKHPIRTTALRTWYTLSYPHQGDRNEKKRVLFAPDAKTVPNGFNSKQLELCAHSVHWKW